MWADRMKATWKECSFNLMLFPQQSSFLLLLLLLLLHRSDQILYFDWRVGWEDGSHLGGMSIEPQAIFPQKKEIANKIWNFYQSGVSKYWWYNFFIFTLVTLVTRVTLTTLTTLASLIAQPPELCSVNQVRANFVDHPKEVLRVFLLKQVSPLREN